MIQDRNIICIASDWFYDPTSKHHIMKLLAEKNHVVWVNYHASRRPRASATDAGRAIAKLRRFIQGPRQIGPNLTVVTPLVLPLPGSRAALALNQRLLSRQIKTVLRTLPARPAQLWSFAPDVDYLCGSFDEEKRVYYCVDEFSEFAGYDRKAILAAEARLASKVDLVVTTSRVLQESKRSLNPRTALITHGVDVEHFAVALAPDHAAADELRSMTGPILGFWGLISDWVDLKLLGEIAVARPDWTIVLIGEPAVDTRSLAGHPNVHILGRRPYSALPAFAKAFDVGLIPFRINDLTRAVNPIKLREYLAAGLPVVASPLPEVEFFPGHVRIASSTSEWVEAIEAAIRSRSASADHERSRAMYSESWRAKVEQACEMLQSQRPHPRPAKAFASR